MLKKNGLWIVADDLGLDKKIDEGIFFAAKHNLINGISIVPNGLNFNQASLKLKDLKNTDLGIHLTLVEESSILAKEAIPSLIGKNGRFYKDHRIFFIRYILSLIDLDQIKKEFDAQINRCLVIGLEPSFLNSHQHLHLLPGIRDILIELAKKYKIQYIRTVTEPIGIKGGMFRKFQLIFLRLLSKRAKNKIISSGLYCNDFFVGFINAGNLSKNDVAYARKLSQKYPDKLVELGCHPGFIDQNLRPRYASWGNYHWQEEIEILQRFKYENNLS